MGAGAEGHQDIYALEQVLEEQSDRFQFSLNGEAISRAELNRMFRTDPDPDRRRQAWEAFGQLSEAVEDDLWRLMVLRNRNAILYGAPVDYGYLTMFVQGIELEWFLDILKTLEERTREPYRHMIESLQKTMELPHLYPWDLQYAMHSLAVLPDEYFPADQSLSTLRRFLANIGFSVDGLPLHISERPGPFGPLGLAIEIPREYRLIVGPQAGQRFYSTLFSEYGRGLYAVHIHAERPIYKAYTWVPGAYSPAYTDAMAEVLGEFTRDPYWLSQYTQIPKDRLQQYALTSLGSDLYSIRSLVTMVSFELEAYKNPMQDLDSLENALNQTFLLVDVPDDTVSQWASMSYLVTNPMYYQNYVLATLITAQVHQALRETFGARLINDPKVAPWLIDNLYAAGESLPWKERIRLATGSDLTVDAFVQRFRTFQ